MCNLYLTWDFRHLGWDIRYRITNDDKTCFMLATIIHVEIRFDAEEFNVIRTNIYIYIYIYIYI